MPRPIALVHRGDAYPAQCARCKRDTELYDLGIDEIPVYGVVYLCTVCVGEFADLIGLVPRSYVDRAIKDSEAEITRLRTQERAEATPAFDRQELSNAHDSLLAAGRILDRLLGIYSADRPVDAEAELPAPFGGAEGSRRDDLGDLGDADDDHREPAAAPGEEPGRGDGAGEGDDVWALVHHGDADGGELEAD